MVYPEVAASNESYGGVHPTAGLAGYPAIDFFAPAGTYVVAPESGSIIRESGTDPSVAPTDPHGAYGLSEYLRGISGTIYFITHLGSESVKVGQSVQAGQPIGTVGNFAQYGTPSHIHLGTSGIVNASDLTSAPKEAGGDVAKLAQMFGTTSTALLAKGPVQSTLEHVPGVTQVEGAVQVGKTLFTDAGSLLKWIGDTHNLERVGEMLAGGVLALVALLIIARSQISATPVTATRGAIGALR